MEIKEGEHLSRITTPTGEEKIIGSIKCRNRDDNKMNCIFYDRSGDRVAYTPTYRVEADGETKIDKGTVTISNINEYCEGYRLGSSFGNYSCK